MPHFDNISEVRFLTTILKWIGLWQLAPKHELSGKVWNFIENYYPYVLHVPLTFTYITLMWLEVIFSESLADASDVFYMSLTETALVVKILFIWHNRSVAWQYIHQSANDTSFDLHSPEERSIWLLEHRLFKRIGQYYMFCSLLVVYSGAVNVLFLPEYELPFAYWLPFDWRNPDIYWYAYAYVMIAMPLTCLSNISLDVINCYFMFHLAQLYRILGLRLSALTANVQEHRMRQELRDIYIMHQKIIGLTHKCESLVSAPILAQIILSALILCFSGYRVQQTNISEQLGTLFTMLVFLSVMTLQIFLPCYYANEVSVHSNNLTTYIYSSDWVNLSLTTKKFIVTYMEMLQTPVRIKVANIFQVGLLIFSKTMNNAYSFFVVLLQMENK